MPFDFLRHSKSLPRSFEWMTWYVLANRTGAEIYINGADGRFHLVEKFSNPQGSLTEGELGADRAGRGVSSADSSIHHALDRHHAQHERVAVDFARRIARFLEEAKQKDRFGGLVLVAGPHFLGLLRAAISPQVKESVTAEIPREFVHSQSDREVRERVLRAMSRAA